MNSSKILFMSYGTKEILEGLLQARGWTEYRLSEESGVGQSTINAILNGRSRQQRDTTLEPIAATLGVTVSQLRGYAPIPGLNDSEQAVERQFANQYPVVDRDSLTDYLSGAKKRSDFSEHLTSGVEKGPRAFVWRADDSALSDVIDIGALVFVDPDYQYDPTLAHPSFKPALIEHAGHYSLRNEETDLGTTIYRSTEKGFRQLTADECTRIGYVVGVPESNWTDEKHRSRAFAKLTG